MITPVLKAALAPLVRPYGVQPGHPAFRSNRESRIDAFLLPLRDHVVTVGVVSQGRHVADVDTHA